MAPALVVIPTYLREPQDLATTMAAIESVKKTQLAGVKILCVDDGSPERSLVEGLIAESEKGGFEVHCKEANSGFSATVNVGLQRALDEGRDAVLMNADVEITTERWLTHFRQTTGANGEPAALVGALLLYPNGTIQHAGVYFSALTRTFDHMYKHGPGNLPEAVNEKRICPVTAAFQFIRHSTLETVGLYDEGFCSPGDEPILMSDGSYAPIGGLPKSGTGLVAVNHFHAGGRILVNGPGKGNRTGEGWPYKRTSRQYAGDLVVLQTLGGEVSRVTPEHRLRVRWTDKALNSWAVYLMRRGSDWRIGTCSMRHGGQNASGPALRWSANEADALWILGLYSDKDQALLSELSLSLDFGVPTALFRHPKPDKQHWLDAFWASRDSEAGALDLLLEYGLSLAAPILSRTQARGRGCGRYVGGKYHGFLTAAANVMGDGLMTVGTLGDLKDREKRLRKQELAVDYEEFEGTVYGLDVPPYHHYLSGGISVHNSMGWEDVDYGVRTLLSGQSSVYNPNIRAFHHEMMFRGRPSEKVRDWQEKSWAYLMTKYKDQSFAGLVPFQ